MISFDFIMVGPQPPRTDRHKLAGTVTVDGVPARRLVAVLYRYSFTLIAATQSDPVTGAWEIKGLEQYSTSSLIVLALDNTGNYNAEVADYVSQVAA